MEEYLIPFEDAESEFTEKRSRFISRCWRVETEAEAQEHIRCTKAEFHDARHHCWCYLLKDGNILRYSDDGEPQGTAGQPMLNVFQREGVFNACCVVTRYFGGILLGAGGLTRAYAKGAKDALNASGVSRMSLWAKVLIPCSYSLYERMKLEIAAFDGVVEETDYQADIVLTVLFPAEKVEAFSARLTELSAGQLSLEVLEKAFRPGPREEAK